MDYAIMSPAEIRALIREQKITGPTTGMCNGYAQANLAIMPKNTLMTFYCLLSVILVLAQF